MCLCTFVSLMCGQKAGRGHVLCNLHPHALPAPPGTRKELFLSSRTMCEHGVITGACSLQIRKAVHTLNPVLPPLSSPLETRRPCPASSFVSWVASSGHTLPGTLLSRFIWSQSLLYRVWSSTQSCLPERCREHRPDNRSGQTYRIFGLFISFLKMKRPTWNPT